MKDIVFWRAEPPGPEPGDRRPARPARPNPATDLREMIGVLAIVALACFLPKLLSASRPPIRDLRVVPIASASPTAPALPRADAAPGGGHPPPAHP